MRIPVRCDLCKHLAHMEWAENTASFGWLTRCTFCTYVTFSGPVMVWRRVTLP